MRIRKLNKMAMSINRKRIKAYSTMEEIITIFTPALIRLSKHDMLHNSYDETCPYCLEDIMSGYKETLTRVPPKDVL